MTDISSELIIVTGASKGIGFSIATALAKKGAVIGALARDFTKAMSEWQRLNLNIEPIQVDLNEPIRAGRILVDWLAGQKLPIKALVNNAVFYGSGGRQMLLETTTEDWERIFSVNVKAAFILCKLLVPLMYQHQDSVILNISSQIARLPAPGRIAYCASKAALDAITLGLAEELSEHKVSVVGLHPGGPVRTPGIERRRPVDHNYDGFLSSDVLDEPSIYLLSGNARRYSGYVLSATDFDNGWN